VTDVLVLGNLKDTILLFKPLSGTARLWFREHLAPDSLWHAGAVVVENRSALPFWQGLADAGLTVRRA
jgi:hypothetical protein